MNEIKSCLVVLCKEIRNLCNVDIKPEHIRLAKFDQVDENNVEALWKVLYSCCLPSARDPLLQEKYGDVLFVKCCLALFGYKRCGFYKLPANKKCGSRELLIAFAWLIAKKNILDVLINEKILEFDRKINICNMDVKPEEGESLPSIENLTFDDRINYISFLCGKLKHNVKHIYNYSEELTRLTDKVHQQTQHIPGIPHLSVDEAHLFLQDEIKPPIQKMASELGNILNTHSKWMHCSATFWKWMDTVLENAESNSHSLNSETAEDVTPLLELIQMLLASFNSKVKNAESDHINSMDKIGDFPRFIYQFSRNQDEKTSELKCLERLLESKLTLSKNSAKDMEMDLYVNLKSIAENKIGSVLFVIPQMYSKC